MDLQRPVAPAPYDVLPATATFTVTSTDITDGVPLPALHSLTGGNVSPQLSWSGFPPQTQSFLLTCFDPDAPTPSGYWHWTVADLDVTVTEMEQGWGKSDLTLPGASFHARTDGGAFAYEGAAPPPGDGPHRYAFAVHALDVETLELSHEESATKFSFVALFHTLARAVITPTFER
ncbi:YbhB/YbcL family Raf kinase inhibitor-like protein [Occultella kanbiaonis]|uniref:YbhB/YbcL family Raf kinase inhibitor-like protein n=1 Tax=Occultella kanbiaonis TaxID=2675754 RepID=UPI0012B8DDA4|nr:YbhB/YbcL family Raf kinase inhibitor-like protein [Occultella kanbiaonis]